MAQRQRDELSPDDYPSVELIYDFVLPSYDWAVRRLDTLERRIDHILNLLFTLTLAVPVVTIAIAGADNNPDFLHWSGIVALGLFLVTAVFGIYVRQAGELTFMDIRGMYEEWGYLTPYTFKQYVTYYAGGDFADNVAFVKKKARQTDLVVTLFFGEIAFGLVWAYSVISSA